MKKILTTMAGGLLVWAGLCVAGCHGRPSALERRRAEIREADSLALAEARAGLAEADSVATFAGLELEDLRGRFVLEKQERYQTVGYYVLPAHAGSKAGLACFPEVEEGGQLLWVAIDGQRRYAFTELSLDAEERRAQLPEGLAEEVLADVDQCAALARAMARSQEAERRREKLAAKVRFYEEKRARRDLKPNNEIRK